MKRHHDFVERVNGNIMKTSLFFEPLSSWQIRAVGPEWLGSRSRLLEGPCGHPQLSLFQSSSFWTMTHFVLTKLGTPVKPTSSLPIRKIDFPNRRNRPPDYLTQHTCLGACCGLRNGAWWFDINLYSAVQFPLRSQHPKTESTEGRTLGTFAPEPQSIRLPLYCIVCAVSY
jgi:hypothetical protein